METFSVCRDLEPSGSLFKALSGGIYLSADDVGLSGLDAARTVVVVADGELLRILRGVRAGGIPPEVVSRPQFIINPSAAGRQGVTLSESVLKNATQVLK